MSVSLSAERDRIQRQVEELEQSLSITQNELDQLSSETGESDDDTEEEDGQSAAGLLAQREKIRKEIQNLEDVLGRHSPICVSDDDSSSSSSSDESELGLSPSVDSCLQMNLVYQQVVQETLDQLETLLTHNHRQQKEVMSQLSGPIKEAPREQRPPSSCQQPVNMFLGRFLKPYFKDKLTGLGPPANQETKEKANRMTGSLDNNRLKVKRWESWQKILLIHSVARDSLRRLIQPKLSKVDYLSQKLSSAEQTDRQQLIQQIDSLEREIDLLRVKKEEELIGERYEEHDWQKISNIDFEGLRDAEDIRRFWQNFLHPSINKSPWSQEEVQQLKEVSRRHGERLWETIAKELGTGRTAFLCLQTYQRFVSDSLRRSNWTPAEDALLRELVDKMRIGNFIPYTQMSYFMDGRDPAQLLYRWNQVLDPSLKKGPWTKQEDELLLQAVSRYGERDWWKIRLEVPGRTDSSCRDRYYDCLKADTKRGLFDKQEKELLRQLVEKHGVGHWAKIAAEIPHRRDGQCLREWRRLIKPAAARAQRRRTSKNPPKSCREAKNKKTTGPAKRRIRRRLAKLNDEEEEEEEEEEEDETVVKYMDSDEEEKKEVVEEERIEEVEKEEKEEEYTFPPMEEWIPAEKAQCSFLSCQLVELSSSGDAHKGKCVRSTILGQFGRSVIFGPPPKELRWEKRHSSSTLMMVSFDQLRAHLNRQVARFRSVPPRIRQKVQTGKRTTLGQMTSRGLDYELQVAVMPWIGNVLIPAKTKLIAADSMREEGEKTQMTSTPVFLLLLQTLNVDSVGCKEMIEKRMNKVPLMPHPAPPPISTQPKNPNSIANLLQERDQQESDHQQQLILQQLILKQLQVLQQQNTRKQLLRKQPAQQRPPPHLPSAPSQSRPAVVLQMSPNMRPQMSPNMRPQMSPNMRPQMSPNMRPQVSLPQRCAVSVQLAPPSPLTTPAPLAVGVTCPSPAPPASQRLNVPPISVVPGPLNSTSTCSASLSQQAGPLIQELKVDSSPSPSQRVPAGSTLPSQPRPPGSTLTPHIRRRQKLSKDPQVVGSSQHGVDAVDVVGEACRSLVGSGDNVMEEGRRKRKLTVKARALQEATEAKAEARRKSASSPRKKAQIQNAVSAHQTVVRPPPVALISSEAPSLPPVSVNSQNTTPACSKTTLSSTKSLHCTQPPSMLTNQHTASSTLSQPVPSHIDHDYSTGQNDSDSVQPSPAPKKQTSSLSRSDPAPSKSSKAPPRRRKRAREEEPTVTSSQDDSCVDGTGAGVTRNGKRVRKPSQRARALQEATEAKAEAKKKRSSSSRSSRTSRSKQEAVDQNRQIAPLPGLSLHHGQSMWVMTPGGMLQLVEVPPQGLKLAFIPSFPATPPLPSIAPERTAIPVQPGQTQPHPLPVPTFILRAVPNPASSAQHPPKFMLPYKGVVRVDPAAPPPLRREALQFDPALMFQESQAAVCDWLAGRGGVVVPGVGVALPYLPPFVSSLSMLSALLCAKKCLTVSSLRLLSEASEPRCPQTTPSPDSSAKETSNQPPDLPDSTSDHQPATDQSAPSVSSDQQGEAELVAMVRRMVAERFSSNPAYQLLKARFLSCFTVPALLATVQPITEKPVACQASEEDEEEEEEQLRKMKERGKQRRAERSLLICDGSGAPANHFSGITTTSTQTTDLTEQTGPDPQQNQNVPHQ